MTAPTPTAATPEELAAPIELVGTEAAQEEIRQDIAAAIRQHSEAQRAEIERLRVMADEPTTKRVWDGIQAMAGLFADPDHMPTVLEFKAAFDAAFVMDGKPYDVERIKEEWQADYAAMEARATAAEAALAECEARKREIITTATASIEGFARDLAAVTAERDMMREALERIADPGGRKSRGLGFHEMKDTARAALQQQETADVR